MSDAPEILFERRGAIGLVTLNRPKALNALSLNMVRLFDPQIREWAADPEIKALVIQGAGEKAFCAGGDVVDLAKISKGERDAGGPLKTAHNFFSEEYILNRLIKTFPKPYVALIDGISMGGGVGLSEHGTHRIVTERTMFAMPETGIGLYPDVGGTYFLSRLPGRVGVWLGLTGDRLKAADMLAIGAADAFIPSAKLDEVLEELAAGVDVDQVISRHKADAGPEKISGMREMIDRCYGPTTVEGIIAALEADGGEWALGQLATLRRLSPSSLKVTLEALRRGAELDFDGCLKQELRLSNAFLERDDFYEGIRAVLIDKDKSPRWLPASLGDISDADVATYFTEPKLGDLAFDS